MDDDKRDRTGLDELRDGQARLAERVRTPWWYLLGFAMVMALFYAMPFAAHYFNWAWPVALLAFLVAFYLLQAGLARATGVDIGRGTLRYPSGRAAGITWMVIMIVAVGAEALLLEHNLTAIAVVTAILAIAVAVPCWRAHLRGIRHDLRTETESM